MPKNKKILVLYRLCFGLLGLSAIVTEIVVLVDRNTFVPANFFSFFTVQSNLFAAIILIGSALWLLRGKNQEVWDIWRGASTLYMVVTGIIFVLLLSGLDAGVLTAVPWDNTVLHYIMPIAVLGDWWMSAPKRSIFFKRALLWLLYPITYVVYTLVRGHFVGWYPYPFLNVTERGYASVVAVCLVVAIVVMGLAWVVARLARRRVSQT